MPVLARLPLSLETRQTSDAGRPIANEGDSGAGKIFKALAADVLLAARKPNGACRADDFDCG